MRATSRKTKSTSNETLDGVNKFHHHLLMPPKWFVLCSVAFVSSQQWSSSSATTTPMAALAFQSKPALHQNHSTTRFLKGFGSHVVDWNPVCLFESKGNSEPGGSGPSPSSSSEGSLSNDPSNESSNNKDKKKSFSFARAGGRRKRDQSIEKKEEKDSTFGPPLWLLGPLLAFGFASLWTFFSPGDDFYYYSYESSIYETSTYNGASGQIETTRRESGNAKTNIPGITAGDYFQEESRNDRSGGNTMLLIEEVEIPSRLDFFMKDFYE